MEIRRFFVGKQTPSNDIFTIEGEEFIHLTKVLRHKVGFKIIVCCGDNFDYLCEIIKIDNQYCLAKIESKTANNSVNHVEITLFQALPKGDKLDIIVQKAVELGASRVVPFLSKFTNESGMNAERERRIAIEACKQCGRATLCKVDDCVEIDDVFSQLKDFDVIIMPYENATTGKIGDIKGLKDAKKIAIIVGSEGGFAEEEVNVAIKSGAQIVSLGKRILRCETASIVTLALVNYEIGEMSI